MHRKTDINELDIPRDDAECWERYPKHRWVYELSRLLDSQNIKWSPFETASMNTQESAISLYTCAPVNMQTGSIFIKKPEGERLISEVYIAKGEVKLIRHINPESGEELPTLVGEIELRLNAFVTLYFTRFTGVISAETRGHDIYRIQLRPHSELSEEINQEIIKLTKRLYRKTDLSHVNGLTDRALHDTLAS